MLRKLKKGWLAGSTAALYAAASGGGGGSFTTWNPADKNSGLTLSGGNLIVTNASSSTFRMVRSIAGHTSGKYYWEVTIGSATSSDYLIGIANAAESASDGGYTGASVNSLGWYSGSSQLGNPGFVANTGTTYEGSDNIGFELDVDNQKLWVRKNGGAWLGDNGGATPNPLTNTQGATTSAITGAIFASVTVDLATSFITANFGGSAYAYTPDAGFGNM